MNFTKCFPGCQMTINWTHNYWMGRANPFLAGTTPAFRNWK